jgi:hypothetical protein
VKLGQGTIRRLPLEAYPGERCFRRAARFLRVQAKAAAVQAGKNAFLKEAFGLS